MRNQYPGVCYRCGEDVAVGAGHFEKVRGGWREQHADCAIRYRGTGFVHIAGNPERMTEDERKQWPLVCS